MDRHTDRQTNRLRDGHMDRHTNRLTCTVSIAHYKLPEFLKYKLFDLYNIPRVYPLGIQDALITLQTP